MAQEWLATAEVIERLGVPKPTVDAWCAKGWLETRPQRDDTPPPPGICGCGCGQRTPLAERSRYREGHVKGQPYRFIHGHNVRAAFVSAASAARMGERLAAVRAARADPGLLTRRQAQEALSVGETVIRYHAAAGELETRRPPGAVFVTRASVERLKAVLAARAAVAAAKHRVAVLAFAGERQALLEATAALVHRRADLTILEAGGAADG